MIGATTTFVPAIGFEEELKRSTDVKDLVGELAEDGADAAEDLAPRDRGDLAESVTDSVVELDEFDGFVGRVFATDFKGHLWEFGTSRNPARPFLRPGVESIGLEVGPDEQNRGF